MDDDLLILLKSSKTFSSLPTRVIKKILPKFEKIELNEGEVLYYQGDPSDSIEFLLSGAIDIILTTANSENKFVGEILPGETVGELGALSGEPRATTTKAAKNSVLLRLPTDIFVELCHQYPSILFAIINPIVSRSQKLIEIISSERFKKNIAIIPANEDVSLIGFLDTFNEEALKQPGLVVLSDYNPALENATHKQIHSLISDAKTKNVKKIKQRTVFILKPHQTMLSDYCFERADMIYVVGDDNARVILNPFVLEKINQLRSAGKTYPELVMLHKSDTTLPKNTSAWLHLANFNLHHHIRLDRYTDYRRLLRFIRNKAIGLVLSGGGTRGWGHVGAIKALAEAGIPIDIVGGSSVGSVIAASYAMTLSYEETLKQFDDVMASSRNSVSWRNLTWPAISLFNGKGLTSILHKTFDHVKIEDLWLPYYCITTNLANNSETIHRDGLLWDKIRASVSLPGIIPPMLLNGELHCDGGLLNNLPIDIMRKMLGHRATIVGVELVGINNEDDNKYDFPPVLTFWETFLGKFGMSRHYKFPPFIDTFLKSLLAGSSLRAQQNGLMANILVLLDLSKFPMLHSNKNQESKIIDIGYQTTLQQIKNMKRKSKANYVAV